MNNDEKPVDDATPAASSSREEDQASHEARSAIDEALQDAVDEVMNEEMFSAADAAELAPEVDELGQLLLKVEEAEQRALRNQAELENFRKRVYREMAVERQYSEESLLRELLQVVDNLDRAYQAASDDSSENTGILQGMQMVRNSFWLFSNHIIANESRSKGHHLTRISMRPSVNLRTMRFRLGTSFKWWSRATSSTTVSCGPLRS
ncbi:MAG TPA: nucleotide exchange factor GrpE [Planctomycetes bacterium]|nr:nucleotide exchange factor GrpE [Planctomycetota bacterium]